MCYQVRSIFFAVLLLSQSISSRASDAASPLLWQDVAVTILVPVAVATACAFCWQTDRFNEAEAENRRNVERYNGLVGEHNGLVDTLEVVNREKQELEGKLRVSDGCAQHFSKQLNDLRVAYLEKTFPAVKNTDGEEKEKKGSDVIWRKAFDPYIGRVPHELIRLMQFMCDPELRATYKADNVLPPRGILLVGPSGSGKSLLCELIVKCLKEISPNAVCDQRELWGMRRKLMENSFAPDDSIYSLAESDSRLIYGDGGAVVVADNYFSTQQEMFGMDVSSITIVDHGFVAPKKGFVFSELFKKPAISCCIASVRTLAECPAELLGSEKFEVVDIPRLSAEDMARAVGSLMAELNPALKPADNSPAFVRAVSYFAQKQATVPDMRTAIGAAIREKIHAVPSVSFSGEDILQEMLRQKGVEVPSEAAQKESFDKRAETCNTDGNQGVNSAPSGSPEEPQKQQT